MKAKADLPYLEWTEPDSGAVVRLYADAITDESANLAAVVSQHPVEKGSKVTDHYRKDPETVSVTYLFSGAPLRVDLDDDMAGTVSAISLAYQTFAANKRPPVTKLDYPAGRTPGLELLNPFNAAQAGLGALGAALGIGGLPKQVTPSDVDGPPKLPNSVQGLTFNGDPRKRFDRAIETVRRLQTQGILVTVKTTFGPFENCGIIAAKIHRSPEMGTSGELALELEQLRFVESDIALALPIPLEPRALPAKTASASGGDEASDADAESVLHKLLHPGDK